LNFAIPEVGLMDVFWPAAVLIGIAIVLLVLVVWNDPWKA
jgi:hypothetical protein